jgi:ABC-type glycerol-3-phosphate transport system substrate-binding protein
LVNENGIFALPLYVDTLAMFYNYDHYRVTKNGKPSDTWADFTEDISRLNRYSEITGELERAAFAMGTENNVNQAIDVIYQLFLQYGVDFYNQDLSRPTFSNRDGVRAFEQFLSYADKESQNYAWSEERSDDVYEFVNGQVSTIIGYSYLYEQIAAQSRTRGLDFRVSKIPQVDPSIPVNYADYWAYTVRKMEDEESIQKMRHAWNFIKSFVSEDSARSYFDMTKRPTARKRLIEEQEKNNEFGVFVNQVRYAKSIKNFDRIAYERLFEDAIREIREKKSSVSKSLSEVQSDISKIVTAYLEG